MTKKQATLIAMATVSAPLKILHPDLREFFIQDPRGWIPNYVVDSDGSVKAKDGSWWYSAHGGNRYPRKKISQEFKTEPRRRPLANLSPEFRGYTLSPAGVRKLMGMSIPHQAKVVMQVLNRALTPQVPVIDELELRSLIEKAKQCGQLKTTRSAWGVFSEQRRFLMSCGALVEVCTDKLGGLHSGIDPKLLEGNS